MRRPLALLAAVIALAAPPAGAGEPLDFELTLLGAPDPKVWLALPGSVGTPSATDAALLAGESRIRFARLATDLALAFSSAVLEPAATTGYNGFAFDLEVATTAVQPGVIGTASYTPTGAADPAYPRTYWPTRGTQPHDLLTPSLHVRKGFPFSTELGGRFIYLSQSSYFAAQLEAKVALVEGYYAWPDVALRFAWTRMLGQPELSLSTSEFDLLVSKRFGVNAVLGLTPYLAARYTLLSASSEVLSFRPDTTGAPATPGQIEDASAAFPNVNSAFYRTTLGLRMTSMAVSMALEATYLGGATQGKKDPGASDYWQDPKYKVPSSLAGAFKFGFLF
jgi:hypothetical protein